MQKNGRCAGFLNTPNNVILTIRMYIYNIYITLYIYISILSPGSQYFHGSKGIIRITSSNDRIRALYKTFLMTVIH